MKDDKNIPEEETITMPCRSCGEETDIDYDIEDFDPANHYCGRFPRCCP